MKSNDTATVRQVRVRCRLNYWSVSMSAGRRRHTIVDVARLAQVSTGTVSNVLANHRSVKLRTRRRVEAAVAELNYRPNRIAQSLTGQPTRVIGMVVPDVTNPFFSELMLDAETERDKAGYAAVCGHSHGTGSLHDG